MASATATATMAAAGFDKRASTASASTLQTPGSGTFPSELLSPLPGSPAFITREDALKTPITPPSAYLDFLKNFSPAVRSPASTTSGRFSFHDKSFDKGCDKVSEACGPKSSTSISPPTSQPSLSRNTSYSSNNSTNSNTTDHSAASCARRLSTSGMHKPESPRIVIPPSPFAKPAQPRSARTPRRLHIPQSPYSPAVGSAQTAPSPYSTTPLSAAPWSASYSPRDLGAVEANGPPGKVHVRHVVTRTVTYCRTPLDPAPRGKRRKIEVEEASDTTSKASSEEPTIKQERMEKVEDVSAAESTTEA